VIELAVRWLPGKAGTLEGVASPGKRIVRQAVRTCH
jgi:hypothetical protein